MNIVTSSFMSAVALCALTSVNAVAADKANIYRVYNDFVTPANQQAYEQGVKSYNKCLAEHGFKYTWTVWTHETGNTYQYSFVSGPHRWATFDAMHDTGKACYKVWMSQANPHLKAERSSFLQAMPEMSHSTGKDNGTPELMTVVFFKLKPGHAHYMAFTNAAKKFAAAAAKTKWPGAFSFGRLRLAGERSPDFILSFVSKNWADYGTDVNPPFWKMVESVYGKKETAALRKSMNGAIKNTSAHMDRHNAELTYTAAK